MAFSLNALTQSHDVEVHWRSYELRPAGSPPMDPQYMEYIEAVSRPRFNAMMQELHGITPNPGPFGILTRAALIVDKYAEAHGKGAAFHDAAFRAYWQEARDISDHAVLRDLAVSVGLDGDAAIAALSDPTYERQVLQDIQQAQQFGLSGVPALIFNNKYLVSGAQPLDVLRQITEQVAKA